MTTSNGKIYGYARVSTIQQDLGLQVETLIKAGVPADNIFQDKLSGKNMVDRKNLQELLKTVQPGDTIYVHKLDRLGRSVGQVISLIDDLKSKGIYIVILDAGIDTRKTGEGIEGMMTKALMTLLGLMAEMEREFIMERTRPAINAAKAAGTKFGPKPKQTKEYKMAIEKYLNGEGSIPSILKQFTGLNEATFYRRLREYKKEHGIN